MPDRYPGSQISPSSSQVSTRSGNINDHDLATYPVSFCLTVFPELSLPCSSTPCQQSKSLRFLARPGAITTYRQTGFHHKSIMLVELTYHRLSLREPIPPKSQPRSNHHQISVTHRSARMYRPSTSASPSSPSAQAPAPAADPRYSCVPERRPSSGAWRTLGSCRQRTGFPGGGAVDTVRINPSISHSVRFPARE